MVEGEKEETITPSIIFESQNWIIVNKPNNLLVHHSYYARNIREKSLVQILRSNFAEIYPVHRLDRKTSGIIVFARTKDAARYLQQQFEQGTVNKEYLALVRGYVEDEGIIDTPVRRAESDVYDDACTHYACLASVEVNRSVEPYSTARYSLIQLQPKTGRQHQLRKHMNKIAHPIIGDPKYGNRHHNHAFEEWFGHSKLFLHAHKIAFQDMDGNKIELKAELPDFWSENLVELGFGNEFQKGE